MPITPEQVRKVQPWDLEQQNATDKARDRDCWAVDLGEAGTGRAFIQCRDETPRTVEWVVERINSYPNGERLATACLLSQDGLRLNGPRWD